MRLRQEKSQRWPRNSCIPRDGGIAQCRPGLLQSLWQSGSAWTHSIHHLVRRLRARLLPVAPLLVQRFRASLLPAPPLLQRFRIGGWQCLFHGTPCNGHRSTAPPMAFAQRTHPPCTAPGAGHVACFAPLGVSGSVFVHANAHVFKCRGAAFWAAWAWCAHSYDFKGPRI